MILFRELMGRAKKSKKNNDVWDYTVNEKKNARNDKSL